MIRLICLLLLLPALVFAQFPDDATVDDNFNRTNADPIGGDWSDLTFNDGGCAIVSNTAQKSGGGAGSCWITENIATGNQEVFASMPAQDSHSTSTSVYVLLCIGDEGTVNGDAYSVRVREDADDDQLQYRRWDNGSETVLGANVDIEFGNGDKVGLKYDDDTDTLSAWTDTGGGWTQQGTRSDSNLTCTNTHVGMVVAHSSGQLDDFGWTEVIAAESSVFQILEFK